MISAGEGVCAALPPISLPDVTSRLHSSVQESGVQGTGGSRSPLFLQSFLVIWDVLLHHPEPLFLICRTGLILQSCLLDRLVGRAQVGQWK